MEPNIVTLEYPIEYGSELLSELSFRRLKTKDLKGIKFNSIGFDDFQKLIERLSGNPPSVVEELDAVDLMKCIEVVSSFLPGGPGTGEKP